MPENNIYLLSEVTDLFELRKGNRARKYYAEHLIIAQHVWKLLFKNTIYAVKRVWMPIKSDKNGIYISVPKDNQRLLSLNVLDKCGDLHPLYFNGLWNTLAKPTLSTAKCECGKCDCSSGICGEVNNFTVTTKPIVINGQTFQEKTYMKYCRNGDIIEYTESWTKKYKGGNTAGDYNVDYNADYNIAIPFEAFEIVPIKTERRVCSLETKECGCPKDTPENNDMVMEKCGCCVGVFSRQERCQRQEKRVSQNKFGEFNFSECKKKIYLRPYKHCDGRPEFELDFILVAYQTDGVKPNEEVQVPEYALDAMWSGIDDGIKRYNDKYNRFEKLAAKNNHEAEKNRVIRYLNPLNITELGKIQNLPTKW